MSSPTGGKADRRAVGRREVGRAGEELAVAWYLEHGYEVLNRNWSCREGELDVVARRGALHVFCEVKARSSASFGLPSEAVGSLKQARVRRLAAMWFAQRPGARPEVAARPVRGGPVRFDVASVLAGVVEIIEGAF